MVIEIPILLLAKRRSHEKYELEILFKISKTQPTSANKSWKTIPEEFPRTPLLIIETG